MSYAELDDKLNMYGDERLEFNMKISAYSMMT
jgi:hypothetical protein